MPGHAAVLERHQTGLVAAHHHQILAIRGEQHRVGAVLAGAAGDGLQELHLVELVVVVAVGHAVQARLVLAALVHNHIQAVKSPQQALRLADGGGDGIDRGLLAIDAGNHPVQAAVLVGNDQAALAVHAQVHPRALLFLGHGVEQLHLEIFFHLQLVGWGAGHRASLAGTIQGFRVDRGPHGPTHLGDHLGGLPFAVKTNLLPALSGFGAGLPGGIGHHATFFARTLQVQLGDHAGRTIRIFSLNCQYMLARLVLQLVRQIHPNRLFPVV